MEFRVATADDRAAIVALCHEVDPQDYVPAHLDRLMETGTFMVAVEGGRVVGIDRVSRLYDGALWLACARVHPDFRGRGLIGALNEEALRLPQYRDASVGRMLISTTNGPSMRAAEKNGFAVAAEVSMMEWEPKRPQDRRARAPSSFVRARALDVYLHVRMSPVFAAQRELLYITPDFGRPTEGYLALAEREGWLYSSPLAGPLFARERPSREGKGMVIQPFAVDTAGAARVLEFVRERRCDWAMLALPDRQAMTEPYVRAGFAYSDWGAHARVYERAVRPTPSAAP
jgi:GNAT superfamily N-acetyltransferase